MSTSPRRDATAPVPPRSAGVLLHPTALPGPHGIGDLGPGTRRFLDRLGAAGQSMWQVLPIGPTGPGGSPYTSPSSFALDPDLVSLEDLVEDGLLARSDSDGAAVATSRTDLAAARRVRAPRLHRAWSVARQQPPRAIAAEEERWRDHPETRAWLDDWALYAAIKDELGGKAWTDWPAPLRRRDDRALVDVRERLAEAIAFHGFVQFVVHRQWSRLRSHARARGIRVVGDLPIYVALDSADVWAGTDWFRLDSRGRPTSVAGVPPDYFSRTGQRWGNPLYRWDRMRDDGYSWWIARARAALRTADVVRLDHFRGFEAYWEIPASERTAVNGRWVPGPGRDLFDRLRRSLGSLPFIAEDLGVITDEVRELRDVLGLSGMKVLQFGFGDGSEHHPDRIEPTDVVYTGTHDNNTSLGWWRGLRATERAAVRAALRGEDTRMPDDLIDAALESPARLAIIPMQDWLGLGAEARFNRPGRRSRNWIWRMPDGAWTNERVTRMLDLTRAAGRLAR